jgi:hypothetical protein
MLAEIESAVLVRAAEGPDGQLTQRERYER